MAGARRAHEFLAMLRYKGLEAPTRKRPERCECCGRKPNGKGHLHYDHDHVNRKFRGWLCHSCNTAIGALGDTPEGLYRALAYLARNAK